MKVFFEKYPVVLKESTAIKMIDKVLDSAVEKCKKKDDEYLSDLALVYDMIEVFFAEKDLNPASFL